jgi:hypothetical protein
LESRKREEINTEITEIRKSEDAENLEKAPS